MSTYARYFRLVQFVQPGSVERSIRAVIHPVPRATDFYFFQFSLSNSSENHIPKFDFQIISIEKTNQNNQNKYLR